MSAAVMNKIVPLGNQNNVEVTKRLTGRIRVRLGHLEKPWLFEQQTKQQEAVILQVEEKFDTLQQVELGGGVWKKRYLSSRLDWRDATREDLSELEIDVSKLRTIRAGPKRQNG